VPTSIPPCSTPPSSTPRSPDPEETDERPSPGAVAIHRELAARGPLTLIELRAALAGQSVAGRSSTVTEDDLDDLVDGEIPLVAEIAITGPPAYIALDRVLLGRVFTHRLTAEEIQSDTVAIEPDLVALSTITGEAPFDQLDDEQPIDQLFVQDGHDLSTSFDLPEGTLFEFGPGDLVGFALTEGGVRIEMVERTISAPADLADHIRLLLPAEEPLVLEELILHLCSEDPELFTSPFPPLAELLVTWQVARAGDYVAHVGFDFAAWRRLRRVLWLGEKYGIAEDEANAVDVLRHVHLEVAAIVDAVRSPASDEPHQPGQPDEPDQADELDTVGTADLALGDPTRGSIHDPEVQDAVRLLADPDVAAALFDETVGDGVDGAAALGVLVESLEPTAPRQVRPMLRLLRAQCRERLGHILAAEADFNEALAVDPQLGIALVNAARYAADRGDAVRALSLLRRAGVPEDEPLIQELEQFVPVERTDVGRNDPCWCGSGRKYKRCHLGRVELAPHDRATWLYSKAVTFLNDGPHREMRAELAEIRSGHQGGDPEEFLGDRAVIDVALFDGGVLHDFLDTRGVLLPDVEQLILAQWLTVERSVFEVEDVERGRSVTLRDIRTGDRQDLADKALSRSVRKGDLACTRLLPVGDTVEIFGGVEPVPLHLLDWSLQALDGQNGDDADPHRMMEMLSARFRPPTLNTGEGDPLVLCSAEFDVDLSDTGSLTTALDENYGLADEPRALDADGSAVHWSYSAPAEFGTRILGSMILDGTRLSVESNSTRRFDEMLSVVRDAVPAASLTSETRDPAADVFRRSRERSVGVGAGSPPGGGSIVSPPLDQPELQQALAEFTADYEKRWLDMELPALAGLTPRQAADDPTRREELVRLLNSFDSMPAGPGAMSPARLRAALRL
jgi:hypothetical protein